jgi:hypothetical protein
VSDTALLDAVQASAGPIEELGATYILHPETFERSTAHGYPHPFAGYFAGRGGVLGDVDPGVVDAVFAVFEPGVVRMFWEQGRPVHGAAKGAYLYQEQIAVWARDHLKDAPGLDRIVELGEKVINAAPNSGLPLFAGWRAMPRATDTPARAMQVLFVLRELRASIHLAALTASGITPVEAHLLNKGPEYAAVFGFAEPWADTSALKARKDEVERITNERMAAIVGKVLNTAEARELADLSIAALKAATAT